MANKKKILEVLTTQTQPIALKRLEEILGEPVSNFMTQVERMEEESPPLVLRDENKRYTITEAGRKVVTAALTGVKYSFPLSKGVMADVIISGSDASSEDLVTLIRYLLIAKNALRDLDAVREEA